VTQFTCWVLFPLVLALLALGCGLLLEWTAGLKLPPGLRLPVGLAGIVVVAEITTKSSATANLTTPLVMVLALAGLALTRLWRERPRPAIWPLVAAGAVYLVYLAPVLFSGEPTFTGFIKLDDTATWMAMTDRVLGFGHDLSGLAPSTYEATLHFYLTGGEPVGAMLPSGIAHQLVGQDLAWEFQPYVAFLGAMLGLAGWSITAPLVRSRPLRALIVFIAAQAALLYGYSLWGGIKEVAAAWLLALTVACTVPVFEAHARPRSFLPLAAASFAMLGVLGYGGAVWIAVPLVVVGLGALRIWLRRSTRVQLAGWLALAVLLAVGLIRGAQGFLKANGALTGNQLGNLTHPLSALQLFGIWPAGDFRVDPPSASALAYGLIAVVIIAACLGLAVAWRARAWAPLLYLVSAAVGTLLVSAKGSPWVQGKAFATVSPAALLVGLAGAAALLDSPPGSFPWEHRGQVTGLASGRRLLAAAGCVAMSVGVLWSNVLAYHHVTVAPYGQLSELSHIGQRFAGQGPSLINEFEPYATRHFLRAMDPEAPSELRRRGIPLRSGGIVPTGGYADLDAFDLPALLVYRTIVIRTSPTATRPPAPYRLVYRGRWYEVWQRPVTLSRSLIDDIPLGSAGSPTAVPACGEVLRLGREAGQAGLLAAATRAEPVEMGVPSPLPAGRTTRKFALQTRGAYELWLAGSFVRHLTTTVDRTTIGATHEVLNEAGGWTPLGTVELGPGVHRVMLSYGDAELSPGGGGGGGAGPNFSVGPLEVTPVAGNSTLTYVSPAKARSLCGKPWEWVEALGPVAQR
jgi:hypothetical protein